MNPAIDLGSGVEQVQPDKKLRCEGLHIEPGGGGVNVARAMKRLGTEATAIFPSGGLCGSLYERLLDDEGVTYHRVQVEHGIRRINTNIREKAENRQYRFCTPGTTLTEGDCKRLLQCVEERLEPGVILVVSGSLPPGAPSDFYAQVAEIADTREALSILDASDSMSEEVAETPWSWILPNKREFQHILGHTVEDRDLENALEDFIENSRIRNMLLTMGKQGILYAGEGGRFRIDSPDVEKVSAVGAGDSATAGLASALAQEQSHQSAIQWAVAAGSAAVMTAGSHLIEKKDFDRLLGKIQGENG